MVAEGRHALDGKLKFGRGNGFINTGIVLGIFAALAVIAKEMEKAARLFGAAQAVFDAIGYKLDKADREFVDHYTGEARLALGEEAFSSVFEEGKQMRLKKAVALARENN